MPEMPTIEVYPSDPSHAPFLREFIEETLAQEGISATVTVVYYLAPDLFSKIGIQRLPAVVINKEVVVQGRYPDEEDISLWIEKFINGKPLRLGWPSTVQEAVDWIIESMCEADKEVVRNTPEDQLWKFHCLWGMGIRNGFGLNGLQNVKLLEDFGRLYRDRVGDSGYISPDDASEIIIHTVWKRLQGEPEQGEK
jgi:hypothetical protein